MHVKFKKYLGNLAIRAIKFLIKYILTERRQLNYIIGVPWLGGCEQ